MPTCKLPYKSSFDNSRVFLQDFEVIDDSFKILNDREFDSLINELEQNNIKAYNISGKPWLKDVSRGSEYAIPNLKVLDKIDQKRKDLGLYEDQLSAEILEGKITRVLSNEDIEKVNKIFKKYPKLDSLFSGNKEVYNLYLESIFPQSSDEFKAKLFFHGTKNPIEGGKFKVSDKSLGKALWFTKQVGYAKRIQNYAEEEDNPLVYGVILNIQNPKHFFNSSGSILVQRPADFEKQYDRSKNDGAVFHHPESSDGKFTNEGGYNQIVVFDGNQVHIIGDENDINKAKEFLKSAQIQLASEKGKPISTTQYQNVSNQSIGITASEKTIRDLAARMSDRIGISVKFISDRSQKFKGKIEDNVAVINLAYATLDTPIHEILGHPIIRVLKMKSEQNIDVYLQEMVDKGIIKKEC